MQIKNIGLIIKDIDIKIYKIYNNGYNNRHNC